MNEIVKEKLLYLVNRYNALYKEFIIEIIKIGGWSICLNDGNSFIESLAEYLDEIDSSFIEFVDEPGVLKIKDIEWKIIQAEDLIVKERQNETNRERS